MKIHLVWIRATAAAALVAGVSVHPAAAQYAPFKPIPPQPVAPQATAPAPQYVAARPVYTQAPTAQYQAPVTPYQPQVAQYPQTAARYPAYSTTPYVAQATPTEALPSPQAPAPAPAPEAVAPATVEQAAPAATAAPATAGYPANCNCGPSGYATSGYGTSCGSYPGVSNYIAGDCGPQNIWFGGVYWLFMDRDDSKCQQLSVEVDHNSVPDPYYPMAGDTVLCTSLVDQDFRSGVEVRLGSTFTVGGSSCNTGCGYGYPGCGPSCSPGNMYAWEVAWWGIDDNPSQAFVDVMPSPMWMHGMKSFAGLEYNGGSGYRPVNDYYGYQMPIPDPGAPSAGTVRVLSQRVYSDFQAQNLELNFMRFGACEMSSCGGGGCASGCGTNACGATGACGSDCGSNLSMYGSCGVRYFRIDDDFSYDTEFGVHDGTSYDQSMPDGWTFDNANELCYDINVDNNLVGPQVGWTTNYAVGCRWNFFLNSTFGIFDNHINVNQRMWSGGGGPVRFVSTTDGFDFSCSKDRLAFLGELRAGGSYDLSCHWRAVAAYRVVAMTGIATATGQIPNNFSDPNVVMCVNSDDSLFVHGVQVGAECRY